MAEMTYVDERVELSDEQLESVTGGYIYFNQNKQWEIIDDKGNVVKTLKKHTGYLDAIEEAERMGYKAFQIQWNRLCQIREANKG